MEHDANLDAVLAAAADVRSAVREVESNLNRPSGLAFGAMLQRPAISGMDAARLFAQAASRCCASRGLSPIAAGGTRIVVRLDEKHVAKIAWRPTWGRRANRNEARVWHVAPTEVRRALADTVGVYDAGAVLVQRRADPLLAPGTAHDEIPVERSRYAQLLHKPKATLRAFGLIYDMGLKQWGRLDGGRYVCLDYPWLAPAAGTRLGLEPSPPNLPQV